MKELKKSLDSKDSSQSVPDCLEGKVTHDTILEKFKECYQDLYNSAGTETAMSGIKEKLQLLINSDALEEVAKVTGSKVKEACGKMKPGKADVTGSYSCDVFLKV